MKKAKSVQKFLIPNYGRHKKLNKYFKDEINTIWHTNNKTCLINLWLFSFISINVKKGAWKDLLLIHKYFLKAIIHPDTGEKIPMPFRMSGFVPFGSPIVVGMIMPTNSLLVTSFWQWFNQSLNAGVNFSNRNATQVMQNLISFVFQQNWLFLLNKFLIILLFTNFSFY